MFGLDSVMLKPLLKNVKARIKAEGIKFIAIIPDEEGDLNTRAFKEPCVVVPVSFMNVLRGRLPEDTPDLTGNERIIHSFLEEVNKLNITQTETPM